MECHEGGLWINDPLSRKATTVRDGLLPAHVPCRPHLSGATTAAFHPYIHYSPAGSDPNATNTSCLIPDPSSFHTYAVEWTPTSIRVIYDGHTCLIDNWSAAAPLTASQPFDQPPLIALTQALGWGQRIRSVDHASPRHDRDRLRAGLEVARPSGISCASEIVTI
jgi:hypothetical protein